MNWLSDKKILIPIDFSDPSLKAAKLARGFVDRADQLYVVHVLKSSSVQEMGLEQEEFLKSRRERSEVLLRSHLSGYEFEGAHVCVVSGDPGNKIIEVAEEVGAELIVVPSRGRSGLSRLIIGSVAERVVRYAACPVLVLRGDPDKEKEPGLKLNV